MTKVNNEWEKQWNYLLNKKKDWKNPDEVNKILTEFVEKTLQEQREIDFDESILNAEKEAEIAKKAYSDGYNDCKRGRKKAPHDTRDGYCCACDYDLAGFKEKLEQQREEIIKECLKGAKDDITGLYDYDRIAKNVIDLIKK